MSVRTCSMHYAAWTMLMRQNIVLLVSTQPRCGRVQPEGSEESCGVLMAKAKPAQQSQPAGHPGSQWAAIC